MKRVLGHCLAGLTVVAGGLACLSAACQHNDSSLFVQDVLSPTPVAQGQTCQFTSDPNQAVIAGGTLDTVFSSQYVAMFLVGNQLVSQSNSQQLKTETSTISLETVQVKDTDANGTVLDNFTTRTSGAVYPSSGTVPGYAANGPVIIASQTAVAALAAANPNIGSDGSAPMVAYVKFTGHTLGGTYVESNIFEFPISVCHGCRVSFAASECLEEGFSTPNCLNPSGSASSLPVPCFPGQDVIIDCSQCQDVKYCRGAYPNGNPVGGCTGSG